VTHAGKCICEGVGFGSACRLGCSLAPNPLDAHERIKRDALLSIQGIRYEKLIRLLQFMMLAVFFLLVWWIAGEVLRSPRASLIALMLAGMTSPMLLGYVNYVLTEMAALVLLTSTIAAAVAARRGRSVGWLFVAGLCLGATALTRPAYLYLGYACGLVGIGLVFSQEHRLRKLPLLLAFVIGLGTAVLPWIARNAIVLDRPALTYGYDSHQLVLRIAYNQMSWDEYGQFYVCGLPDGVGLGKVLFGPKACERFSWDPAQKNSFYNIGKGPLMEKTLAAAGGWPQHLSYVIRNYILMSPLRHLLVTVPFTLAGAWIKVYWGLVLGIACVILTVRALRVGDKDLLVVTLPCWFMLLFHASVAINQNRFNLILILPYSIAGAWLVERVLQQIVGVRGVPQVSDPSLVMRGAQSRHTRLTQGKLARRSRQHDFSVFGLVKRRNEDWDATLPQFTAASMPSMSASARWSRKCERSQ
jgi:hypothetical protein